MRYLQILALTLACLPAARSELNILPSDKVGYEVAAVYAKHGITITTSKDPSFAAQLQTLTSRDGDLAAVARDLLPLLVVVTNTRPRPVQTIPMRYTRINRDGQPRQATQQFHLDSGSLRGCMSGAVLITPEGGLTTRFNACDPARFPPQQVGLALQTIVSQNST
jgi:hypothetical protein